MIARLLSPAGPLLFLVLLFPACQSSGDRGADLPTGEAATRAAHEEVGFDVDHYSLDVTLDPEARAIEGRCAIRFVATREGLTAVRLDLEELRVSDAVDERGQRLNFMQSNGSVKIELRSPLEVGDLGEVEVTYGGTPRKGVWFVGDDGTTGPTHVFTQGECEDARFWFPCRDVPADRATHDLNVTMPADWRSVAGGERNGESTSREQRSESWSMRFPLPTYLFTLVAGEEMERYEDSWEDVPLAFVSPKEHSGWLTESLADTDEALAFLEDFAGREYPFTKYTQCCVEDFPFGGMENASATTLTVAALGDERYLRDTPATSLVVHEAAHQWFGDLLTCATWPHIWLNEGFATYCALLFVEETEGRDAFLTELRDIQEAYIRGDSGANRRAIVSDVYKDPIDLFFGGHTYQGGASRLHLLRHVLGEEDFRAGVHRYVSLHENRGVVTSDLRRAFEEASERDLERFFDQWLLSPGHPVFETRWRWDAQGSRVLLTVDQVQDVGDGTPTAFEAPVDIEIRTQSDATLHRVQLTKRRHLFQIPVDPALDGEPLWVRFDAQGALPKEHYAKKSPEEWVAIAERCEDPNGRRDALSELGGLFGEASEAQRALLADAITRALEVDASPAVRVRAAEVLRLWAEPVSADLEDEELAAAERRHAAALQLGRTSLIAKAENRSERVVVRRAALDALANYGEDAELAVLAERIFQEGPSWKTMIAAAKLYRSSVPDAGAKLQEWMEISSPHEILRAGIVGEMARVPETGLLTVAGLLAPTESNAVRMQAARSLGDLAPDVPEVRRLLLRLLDDSSLRVRFAALQALENRAGSPEVATVLREFYAQSVFPREKRAIERMLRARP